MWSTRVVERWGDLCGIAQSMSAYDRKKYVLKLVYIYLLGT